eukprot:352616-Chlamydomonas_euryale.AAC.13
MWWLDSCFGSSLAADTTDPAARCTVQCSTCEKFSLRTGFPQAHYRSRDTAKKSFRWNRVEHHT